MRRTRSGREGIISDTSGVHTGYSDTSDVLWIDSSNSSGLGIGGYSDREGGAYSDTGKMRGSTVGPVQGITWMAVEMSRPLSVCHGGAQASCTRRGIQ